MHRLVSLAVFLSLVMVAAAVAGQFVGGDWYHGLSKPSWTPSAIVMAPVWAVLYVLMAVAAWLVWETIRGAASLALACWGLQLLHGIAWSWVFFGVHRLGWALAVVSLWIIVVLIVIRLFRSIRSEAASLMIPLVAWLVFLWGWCFSLWYLNGGGLGSVL